MSLRPDENDMHNCLHYSISQRVAQERHCSVGSDVGYAVRFDDCTSDRTKIKFMTDGVLLRECLADKYLSEYSVVMLDEAHERSMNTDILFGLLKEASRLRDDLKVTVLGLFAMQ
jgi:ATP-dependent RNA helicase DHX8/PRP22